MVFVEGRGSESDHQFDLDHDHDANGASLSCDISASATDVRDAIQHLQTALEKDDVSTVIALVYFPMTYIDKKGRRHILHNGDELKYNYFNIFTEDVKKMIYCANLSNMSIVHIDGISWFGGRLWMYPYAPAPQSNRLLQFDQRIIPNHEEDCPAIAKAP